MRSPRCTWPIRTCCWLALVFLGVARVARADQDVAPWTLERASQVALERSPAVRAAQAELEASRAYRAFGQVPRLANPHLNVRAMIGEPDDPAATYSVLLGFPIDVSGRRRAWRKEASWAEHEAEANLAMVQNEARA